MHVECVCEAAAALLPSVAVAAGSWPPGAPKEPPLQVCGRISRRRCSRWGPESGRTQRAGTAAAAVLTPLERTRGRDRLSRQHASEQGNCNASPAATGHVDSYDTASKPPPRCSAPHVGAGGLAAHQAGGAVLQLLLVGEVVGQAVWGTTKASVEQSVMDWWTETRWLARQGLTWSAGQQPAVAAPAEGHCRPPVTPHLSSARGGRRAPTGGCSRW